MGEFVGLCRGGYCVPAASSNEPWRNRGSRRGKRKQGAQRPADSFRPPEVGGATVHGSTARPCFADRPAGDFAAQGLDALSPRRERLPRNQQAVAEPQRDSRLRIRHPITLFQRVYRRRGASSLGAGGAGRSGSPRNLNSGPRDGASWCTQELAITRSRESRVSLGCGR
jgi:hypothetical protein